MTRNDLIECLWQQSAPYLFIKREEFFGHMDGWDMEPVAINGQLAFIVATKGAEFHFASLGTHRLPLQLARQIVQRLVDVYGFAMTRAPKEDQRQHLFNLAFGFEMVHETEYDVVYQIGSTERH